MDEYISRQAAVDALKATAGVGHRILDRIRDLPAVDAAPVVRCGECVFTDRPDGHEIWCTGRGYPEQLVPPDGFCDKGRASDG